jgi:imidazolonepropionase-like amidohydrolase
MSKHTRLARLAALLFLTVQVELGAQASRTALSPGSFAIVGVNVIPMHRDTVFRNSTVLVENGRISRVGPQEQVRVPDGVVQIDGSGKFLIPGLADMHAHLYSDGYIPDSLARYELGVFLANGVTAARLMIGTPEHFAIREAIMKGTLTGPQFWIASPELSGRPAEHAHVVTTPEQGTAAVKAVADSGYEFIKVTNFITRPVYDAILAEAKRRGIRVDGHVDPQVGLAHALASGQAGIHHLDSYFEAVLADSAPMRESVTQVGHFRLRNWESMDFMDDRKIAAAGGATARAGIWSTPTLTLFNYAFAVHESDSTIRNRPDWKLMPAPMREMYLEARPRYWSPANEAVRTEARRRRYVEVRHQLVKAIVDSGGKVMAGSDAPDWFMSYGWTLHRELASFVEAGLTPYQALQAATVNPAQYLNALDEWGTIERGKRADLVLLAGNPLEQITNTTRIDGVAIGGTWIPAAELDRMTQTAYARIGAGN